jgi:hypothetical protein
MQKMFLWPHSKNPGETFDGWATESRQRSASVRQMLAHRTSASGGGCWLPTPTAQQYGTTNNGKRPDGTTFKQAGKPSLATMAKLDKWPTPLLPTPKASDGSKGSRSRAGAEREWRRGKNVDLGMVVAMWPTPKASPIGPDYARVHRPGSGGDDLATAVAKRIPTPTARDWRSGKVSAATHARNSRPLSEQIGGPLNPLWVEWLMGWPLGFTVCVHWATGKSRSAQRKRGAS